LAAARRDDNHDDVGDGAPAAARQRSVLAEHVVGRDHELAALGDAVSAATQGRGSIVFLVGEAGIGKSRLAQVSAGDAEQRGLRVLRGRAVPTATPVAFRPLAEVLSSAVRAGTVPDAAELAPFRSTLGRLVPAWRDDALAEVDDSVLVLAEGVLRFLRGVAHSDGCVVVLEDLHWADPETLTILEYLADNLADERVVCVATVRDESPSPGLDLARTLHARRASDLIELRRLGGVEMAEMLESCLGIDEASPELMALAARADGVPFLVEELLAVAVASGALVHSGTSWTLSRAVDHVVPMTFVDSVRRRLVAMSDEARTVLAAAAILGRRFDWDLLPTVTGLDEGAVVAALHAAVDTQIVAVDQDAFRFRHALSRDAVLAELLPPERARLSARALDVIEQANPGVPGHWCELAADVAEGAGDRSRAAALLLEAGRRALDDGALTTAETTLERARVLAPSGDALAVDVEESLATVLALAGKRDRAVEVGESLLAQLGSGAALAHRRAEAHLRLARAEVAGTRWAEAEERLARASAEAADLADDRLRARIDVVAAQVAIMRRPENAVVLARGALDVAERLDLPEVACEALEVIGRFERQRDLDAAEAVFARAFEIADGHGRAVWRVRALHELGTIDLLRGGGLDRFEQARELALALGALSTVAVLDVQISAALAIGDDPEPSLAVARRATELARRYRLGAPLAAALAFEAVAHARAGRRTELERCLAEASEHGDSDFEVIAEFARVLLAFVEEDRDAARRHLERAAVALPQASGDQATGPAAGLLALVLAVDDDDMDHWPAHEPVHFLARGFLRHAEAVVAGRAGDVDAALGLLLRGDEVLADVSWFRHCAHRLVAEAALADGWGDPVAWLTDALRFFDRNGDQRLASACRSLLRKAGAPVPRRRAEEVVSSAPLRALGLTARELEVLRLLGEGLSNKDIGARLYLSPRTVERHIASLTAKAGVSRRSELVAFAARSVGPN
jgi:DNA-binding CsgD family transcriptional regulator/tetratricopeptide (TPR) repeat protein